MSEETTQPVQALKAHLALNVRNVESSTEFYRKMLGIEPSKVRNGYAKFDVQNPPLNLTLNQVSFKERGALSHLGIQVAETADVLRLREQWIERGLTTREEMQTNCCYALQDKAWVSDPDGNEWEVFVVLQDNLTETSVCCTPDAAVQAEETAASSTSVSTSASPSTVTSAASSSCCSTSSTSAPTAISR